MIPDVSREVLLEVMSRFDREARNLPEWQRWEDKENHKFAIEHEGRRYPVKWVVRTATAFADFGGGREANSYVEQRGFNVVRLREGFESLQDALEAVLSDYAQARSSEPFGNQSEMYRQFRRLEQPFSKCDPVDSRPHLQVKASPGQGNWSKVPWISFLDSRETDSTQRGVYCVYLFREDMTGVYLTLNQGVTQPLDQGWRVAEPQLREVVTNLRRQFPELASFGFALTDDIDLRTSSVLGETYEVGTIAHKLYQRGQIPADGQLLEDLDKLLGVYEKYVDGKSSKSRTWIFQANPDRYDLAAALRTKSEMAWLALQRPSEMSVGDRVYMWESGTNAGIVGKGAISQAAANMPFPDDEVEFSKDPEKFNGVQPRVRLRIDGTVTPRVAKAELENHPLLSQLAIVRAPRMTNYLLSEEEGRALDELVRTRSVGSTAPRATGPVRPDLVEITQSFAAALQSANLSFGSAHMRLVRSFIASLVTKRFVILTGLSGSGKTQIALKFGEWLGGKDWKIVAVRPDWTGSDALFGYEDALQTPAPDGRRSWHAPDVLQFILQAASNADRPHLLILDEMNLAHVERYFADVLSGMETRAECIPNLQPDGAFLRIPTNGPKKIPFPRNLFVVGTVNVDETTYLFSPKVLDRANTFEFRVLTADLASSALLPQPATVADSALTGGLLSIALDDRWQSNHQPSQQGEFIEHLKRLHTLLSEGGFEFGHRVFYEALRFAAIYAAAGDTDPFVALDLQVMQKVMPRLHGSRRRLEPTLCAVGLFCHDLTFDSQLGIKDAATRFDSLPDASGPRLPISFEKISRMIRTLRANQFVSFTE